VIAQSRRQLAIFVAAAIAVSAAALIANAFLRRRAEGVAATDGTVTYNLVTIDDAPPPWLIIDDPVMQVAEIGGSLQIEAGKSSGKAWTTISLRNGVGEQARVRTTTTKDDTFVLSGRTLEIISGSDCKRTAVFTLSRDKRTLRQTGYREEGPRCNDAPPEVATRLRALRERQREYKLVTN
jgi:hypothetical protein